MCTGFSVSVVSKVNKIKTFDLKKEKLTVLCVYVAQQQHFNTAG